MARMGITMIDDSIGNLVLVGISGIIFGTLITLFASPIIAKILYRWEKPNG